MQLLPSFSAVVEWENAKLAGAARATEMLRELLAQSTDICPHLQHRPELIILYESTDISRADIESALAAAGAATSPTDVRIRSADGASYYQQKNIGAAMASREFVLFVDSDVIPEPGWLRALLSSAKAGANIVGGDTYIDPTTFIDARLPRSGSSR